MKIGGSDYVQLAKSDSLKTTGESLHSRDKSEHVVEGFMGEHPQDDFYNTFKFMASSQSDEIMIKYLSNSSKLIRSFDLPYMLAHYELTEAQWYMRLLTNIENISALCLNSLTETFNEQEVYNEPNENVQRVIRESGCIDFLADLLERLFPSAGTFRDDENRIEEKLKSRLIRRILNLISITVKGNKDNQYYCYKYILPSLQKYVN